MFARITKYKMKPGSRGAATKLLNELKAEIMGMPEMLNFVNVMDADGGGYVVAVNESEATSNANAENSKAVWGRFAEHLEAAPTPEGHEVIANWSN